MAELIASRPAAGLVPVRIADLSLTEESFGALTSLSPRRGAEGALGAALQTAHGLGWPAPNRSTQADAARLIWFGHAHALLIGPDPAQGLHEHAALTDQSDAWVALRLAGDGAEDVLARLVPIDLRASQFETGHTARSLLGHAHVSLTRTGDDAFLILGFRSMAKTLVHELELAMNSVAARKGG